MKELIFSFVDAPESGYSARPVGESIFTQGGTLDELRRTIRRAVDS